MKKKLYHTRYLTYLKNHRVVDRDDDAFLQQHGIMMMEILTVFQSSNDEHSTETNHEPRKRVDLSTKQKYWIFIKNTFKMKEDLHNEEPTKEANEAYSTTGACRCMWIYPQKQSVLKIYEKRFWLIQRKQK